MEEQTSVCYLSVNLSLKLSSLFDNLTADERNHTVLRKFHPKARVV